MPRKKKIEMQIPLPEEEIQKEAEEQSEMINVIRNALRPTHRLKICCHKPGVPEFCDVIELPFKPTEGDLIAIKPKGETDDGARITVIVHGLIFDHDSGYWVMRPDIIDSMRKHNEQEGTLASEVDPLHEN